VIQNTIFFALNLSHRPVSGRSNECAYSSTKSLLQRTSRQFVRVTRVRQFNFGSGSQCSSHYLKAHGFLGTPGSSARVESSISGKSFPGVRAIFPVRDADAGNLGMLFGAQVCIAWAE
jgi:hypothetical protein